MIEIYREVQETPVSMMTSFIEDKIINNWGKEIRTEIETTNIEEEEEISKTENLVGDSIKWLAEIPKMTLEEVKWIQVM